jgi:hypothetical protein
MTTTDDGPQVAIRQDSRGPRFTPGPIEVIPWNVEFADAIGSLAHAIDAVRGSGVPLGVADLSVLMQVMRLGPGHAVVLASMLCRLTTAQVNGPQVNGLKVNGLKVNGPQENGLPVNGLPVNGPQVHGPICSPVIASGPGYPSERAERARDAAGRDPSAVMPRQGSLGPRAVTNPPEGLSVAGLYIPAAIREPLRLIAVRPTESGIAEAVGSGAAEEELNGEVDGGGYTVYLDQHRVAKGLADNERAARLVIALGHGQSEGDELRGDVVVLGSDQHLADTDVPCGVLEAALGVGVLSEREVAYPVSA